MKLYYATTAYNDADIIIIGLPLDRTSSFIPGSRFGPQFIRQCSENIEEYSPYQDKRLSDLKICDLGDLHFETNNWLLEIEQAVKKIFDDKKIPILLGGEHTITLPIIKALKRHYPHPSVVQFDAHCDLRDEYLGEKVCHATVIRRVSDLLGIENIYQFGIRSGTEKEFQFNKNLYKFNSYQSLKSVIGKISAPIYLTIDLDVLDPAVLPATSTPAPGGISYQELLNSLLLFKDKKIISVDIVEYNPLAASPYSSGCVAAEILREVILLVK